MHVIVVTRTEAVPGSRAQDALQNEAGSGRDLARANVGHGMLKLDANQPELGERPLGDEGNYLAASPPAGGRSATSRSKLTCCSRSSNPSDR